MKSQTQLSRGLLGLVLIVTLITAGCGPAAVQAEPYSIQPVLDTYIANLPEGFYGVKPEAALQELSADPKPFLIDVREPKDLADGFIAGAVNIPIRSLTQSLDKLPAKDQPIIVYCAIGHRGAMAMTTLRLLGYTNVKSIFGGFNGWKNASLPVATGEPAMAVAGAKPEVDADLFAALDNYISNLPDDFYVAKSEAALKELSADPKPFLVDVREPKELTDNGYIDGAVNIPIRTLLENLDKLPQDKNAPIITYCAIGHRGAMAMTTLRLLGYTNVKSVGGGFNGWVKASLPIVK